MLSDQEFLEVLNVISSRESTENTFLPLESLDDRIDTDRLDSLGIMMFFVWLVEIFGIEEGKAKEVFQNPEDLTVDNIRVFVEKHKTKGNSMDEIRRTLDEMQA